MPSQKKSEKLKRQYFCHRMSLSKDVLYQDDTAAGDTAVGGSYSIISNRGDASDDSAALQKSKIRRNSKYYRALVSVIIFSIAIALIGSGGIAASVYYWIKLHNHASNIRR